MKPKPPYITERVSALPLVPLPPKRLNAYFQRAQQEHSLAMDAVLTGLERRIIEAFERRF